MTALFRNLQIWFKKHYSPCRFIEQIKNMPATIALKPAPYLSHTSKMYTPPGGVMQSPIRKNTRHKTADKMILDFGGTSNLSPIKWFNDPNNTKCVSRPKVRTMQKCMRHKVLPKLLDASSWGIKTNARVRPEKQTEHKRSIALR